MKALLLFFSFFVIQILVSSEDASKNVKYVRHLKIPILNAKKYIKKPTYTKIPIKFTRKNNKIGDKYTVFQSLQKAKQAQRSLFGNGPFNEDLTRPINVPDSLIFSLDSNFEHKTRVKKVLPSFFHETLQRRKRAAANPKSDLKGGVKVEEKKKKEVVKKSDQKETNLNSNPKDVKTLDKKVTERADQKSAATVSTAQTKPSATKSVVQNKENNKVVKDPKKKSKRTHGRRKKLFKRQGKAKAKKNLIIKKNGTNSTPQTQVLSNGTKVKLAKSNKKISRDRKSKVNSKKVLRSKPKKTGRQGKKSKKSSYLKKKHLRGKKSKRQGKSNRQKLQKDTRRLVASKPADIATFPFVVSIQRNGEHWCSGAILNQRIVITTANCVWKSEALSHMNIRACSRYTQFGGILTPIELVMKHTNWSIRATPQNDVALLRTQKPITFSHSCHAVDLPNANMKPPFEDVFVTSWGAERRDGLFESGRRPLQVHHVSIMDEEECNNITMRFGITVKDDFFCTYQTGRRAPCTRDTGAPAVSDGILWGMASWGLRKKCGTERFPAMFSYLGAESNIKFISYAMSRLMTDMRESPFLDRKPVKAAPTTPQAIAFY